jgi:Protein kinase domain
MIRRTETQAQPHPTESELAGLQRAAEKARLAATRAAAVAEKASRRASRSSEAATALASAAARVRRTASLAAERATAAEQMARRAGSEASVLAKRASQAKDGSEGAARANQAARASLEQARRILRAREQQKQREERQQQISPQEARKIFSSRGSRRAAAPRQTPSHNFPVIAGYRVLERAGQDGTAEFFRARQVQLDRAVLLKVLHADRARDPRLVEAFLAEARRAAQFNHPNLVRVHDLGCSGKRYYYATEMVDGPSLESLLGQLGPLEPGRAHKILRDLAAGMARWEAAGLVHGGVNPECVLFDGGGVAKLTGLGMAAGGNGRPPLVPGTVNYVAPELAAGRKADARADEYSLGALFYLLLTGRAPHAGPTLDDVVRSAQRGPLFLSNAPAALPAPARRLIRKAMATNPADRHGGPAKFVAALDLAQPPSGGSIPVPRSARLRAIAEAAGPRRGRRGARR